MSAATDELTDARTMSGARRAVVVVLGLAVLSVVGWWWVSRDGGPDLDPTEHVVADVAPGLALDEVIRAPADALGCSGYSFRSTVPLREGMSITDRGLIAASLPLGGRSYVQAFCFGPVDEVGTPEELMARALEPQEVGDIEWDLEPVGPILQISSAHGDGPALTTELGGVLLTNHYVVRDGYVHVVGLWRPAETPDAKWDEYLAILATWQWDD